MEGHCASGREWASAGTAPAAGGLYRAWLGELCRIAARLLLEAYALPAPGARPGLILFVQTFGDLANFNPHVHVLATDGAFLAEGSFVRLPPVPEALLEKRFQQAVLDPQPDQAWLNVVVGRRGSVLAQ